MELITAAAAALTAAEAAYNGKIADINARQAASQAAVNGFIADAASRWPLHRVSKNQAGAVDAPTANIQYWTKNGGFNITVVELETIPANTPFNQLTANQVAILNAMGNLGYTLLPVPLKVLKMTWANWNATIFPSTIWPGTLWLRGWCVSASYARLISGGIGKSFLEGVNANWGLCGQILPFYSGRQYNWAPEVTSAAGEVHFVVPAVAQGYIPIDRANPLWGWLPLLSAVTE